MSNVVRYTGDGSRGPSPAIFGDVAKLAADAAMGKCVFLFDDFIKQVSHANALASGHYYTYQDTGVTISSLAGPADLDNALGVIRIAGNDADNDEGHIQFTSEVFGIDNADSGNPTVLFEARVRKASIADNAAAFFLGLVDGPVAADHLIDDTGVLGDFAALGLRVLQDNGEELDCVYKASGQTQQENLANAATLVANTWVKLGFAYRPQALPAKKITWYVNGAPLATFVTETQIDAATFPEGEALAAAFLTKVGTAAESTLDIDWVCCAQYSAD